MTLAGLCATCDPIGSTHFAGNNEFYVSPSIIKEVKANCADVAQLNANFVFPYLKALNNLARCDVNARVVIKRHSYLQDSCQMNLAEIQKCRGTTPVVMLQSNVAKSQRILAAKRRMQALVKPVAPATAPVTPAPAATTYVSTEEDKNCFGFAMRIITNGVGKAEPCTQGDPDFVRGIYMNVLQVLGKNKDVTFEGFDLADNAVKIKMDKKERAKKNSKNPIKTTAPNAKPATPAMTSSEFRAKAIAPLVNATIPAVTLSAPGVKATLPGVTIGAPAVNLTAPKLTVRSLEKKSKASSQFEKYLERIGLSN